MFDVADLLGSLVNKSLVTAERRTSTLRYRLLETIRQFAADQLQTNGGDDGVLEVQRAHAQHYLKLAESCGPALFGPDQGRWLNQLDLEWDNLRTAFAYFAEVPGGTEELLRLGIAVRRLLTSRFHLEPLALLREALAGGGEVSEEIRARALLETSIVIVFSAFFNPASCAEALGMLEESVGIAHAREDQWLEAQALSWLSLADQGLGQLERARARAGEALVMARQLGDPWVIGGVLLQYGKLLDSPEETRSSLLEALGCFRQVGDHTWTMSVLSWLARSEVTNLDQIREAQLLVEEAVHLGEENGDVWWLTNLYSNLAIFCYLLGEQDEAEAIARRCMATVRRLGMAPSTACELLLVLALSAAAQQDFARAANLTGAFEIQAEAFIGSAWLESPLVMTLLVDNRATLEEALGTDVAAQAIELGRRLPFDQVTALALGVAN
jgi:non-specific serine/threonine protein kinase